MRTYMKEGLQKNYQEGPKSLTRRSFLKDAVATAAVALTTEKILSGKKAEAATTPPVIMPFAFFNRIPEQGIEVKLSDALPLAGCVAGALAGGAASIYPVKKSLEMDSAIAGAAVGLSS